MEHDKKKKSCKSRRETAVQGTNDSSIVSKCSMAAAGYFNDQYLKEFVAKTSRRSPLINRGYYIRAVAINYILKKFLSCSDTKKQILSLGAGFDSAYFRLKSENLLDNVVFCEIDFPDVVKRKHTVISTNAKLNELIPGYFTQSNKEDQLIEINTEGYKLLGVDLTQHNTLEALLNICGIDFDIPTLLLSECVLTYMTKRCSSSVVKWAAETFSNSTFVLYEQINPNDAFGLFMQNHFKTVGSALKCINAYPTIDSQLQRFQNLGWEKVDALDMNQFYLHLVSPEEKQRIENLEPFDEYEEWHLKCSHYMVLCAYNGACNKLLTGISSLDHCVNFQLTENCVAIETVPDVTSIMRIGHASTAIRNVIITIAGFGNEFGKHQRLSSVSVTDSNSFKSKLLQLDVDLKKIEGRLRHTLCSLTDESVIMIGGRMSPIYSCTQVIKVTLNSESVAHTREPNTEEFKNDSICDKESKASTSLQTNLNSDSRSLELLHGSYVNSERDKLNSDLQVRKEYNDKEASNSVLLNSQPANVNNETRCLNTESNLTFSSNYENLKYGSVMENLKNDSKINSESNSQNEYTSDIDITNNMGILPNIKPLKENNVKGELTLEDVGCNESKNINVTDVPEFDIESVSVKCFFVNQDGEIPVPRWRHSAVVIQKSGKELIFIYGGRNEKQLALNCGHFLDTENGNWTRMCSTGSEPGYRHSHTASVWKNEIIIAGGLDLNIKPLNNIHLLNFETLVWRELKIHGDLLPRYSHTAEVVGDLLVLISGVNLYHDPPGVAVINLMSGACIEYSLPVPDPTSLVMLHQHQMCYLGNGKFVIIGGGGNCFSFGTHLNRSPYVLDISRCLKIL